MSLHFLGFAILISLIVDFQLRTAGLGPPWWLGLRIPLSLGLGTLTVGLALFA